MRVSLGRMKKMMWAVIRDESGQSTTEYVLLRLFVVIAVKSGGGTLRTRLENVMNAAFGKVQAEIDSGP